MVGVGELETSRRRENERVERDLPDIPIDLPSLTFLRAAKKNKIKYGTYFFFLMLNLPFQTKGKIREREKENAL